MLRARGLIALLEASRQARASGGFGHAAWAAASSEAALHTSPSAGLASPANSAWACCCCRPAGMHIPALASPAWRGFHTTAAAAQQPLPQPAPSSSQSEKQVLYRGKGMRLFRLLVRMKVFQLAGIAALAVPINTFLATGNVASTQLVMASALVVGAGVASTALWYYSRRYLGELALLPGPPCKVRLSVLDFWGNREDKDVALQALVPPLQNLSPAAQRAALQEPLLPVDVEGDRQYFLSLRYGKVLDQPTLKALLTGQLEGQQLSSDGNDYH